MPLGAAYTILLPARLHACLHARATLMLAALVPIMFVTAARPTKHDLWSTPLFTSHVDNADELNAELLREAMSLRQAHPDGGGAASNRGGWRTVDRDLHARDDLPAMSALRSRIEATADVVWYGSGTPRRGLVMTDMWLIMLGPGDWLGVHKHAEAMLAGVYWVNAPATVAGAAGALKLRDPQPQTSVYDGLEWMGFGTETQVSPQAGLMALWPAWLEHYVEPFSAAPQASATVDARGHATSTVTRSGRAASKLLKRAGELRVAVSFNFRLETAQEANRNHSSP